MKNKEYKTIVVIPAGRKRYLEILIKNILNQSSWDELHLWKNTRNKEDCEYIDSLKILDSRIKVIEIEDQFLSIHKFFHYCIDENTVYIRFDDDVCWIEPGLIKELAETRWKNQEYFLVSPIIINNAVMTHLLQKFNKIDIPYRNKYKKINFYCLDNVGWKSSKFALDLHNFFIDKLKNNDIETLKFENYEIPPERYSINCISWLGKEFSKFNGKVDELEEQFISAIKPDELNKKHLIMGSKICVHFAFYVQRNFLEKTDLLQKYREISNV
jgi:hypothetical protein